MTLVDLSGQIRERLQQWERLASKAGFGWGHDWTVRNSDQEDQEWSVVDAPGKRDMVGSEDEDVTALIAAMDPAAVLALTAGLRDVLDYHCPDADNPWLCEACGCQRCAGETTPCPTVRSLARAVGVPVEEATR